MKHRRDHFTDERIAAAMEAGYGPFGRFDIEGSRFDGPRRSGRGPRGDGPPFGPPFGGPPFGGPPFGRGRGPGRGRVRRGQIRTALLALLEDEPMHGYEMIRQIDDRSGGRWKPSPGAVYPTLQQLADEGLVTVVEEDGKRIFSLTDEGRAAVDDLSDGDREPWVSEGSGHPAWELKPLMKQVGMAAAAAMTGTPEQVERAKDVLNDARRKLYAILAEDPGDAPAPGDDLADEVDEGA